MKDRQKSRYLFEAAMQDPTRLRTYLRHLQPAAAPTQRPGDLSSVRLTTPGGELSGPYALDVFELVHVLKSQVRGEA